MVLARIIHELQAAAPVKSMRMRCTGLEAILADNTLSVEVEVKKAG